MMHLMAPPLWGMLAGLTGLAGYLPYLRDAWRRASDPDPSAWLIWTVQYSILLASQVAQHPPWPALVLAGLQLAGTVAVFAVLAARGGWRFSASRWAVLGCAAAVMTLWWFTKAPASAMCLALAVEGAGMVLVMLNAYRRPGSETIVTWWVFIAAGLFDLPALWQHTPRMLYAYPVFFIVMGAGVLVATALGERVKAQPVLSHSSNRSVSRSAVAALWRAASPTRTAGQAGGPNAWRVSAGLGCTGHDSQGRAGRQAGLPEPDTPPSSAARRHPMPSWASARICSRAGPAATNGCHLP